MGRSVKRLVGGMFVALAAALLLLGGAVSAASVGTGMGPGNGGRYISPAYGYTVSWNAPWAVTQQTTDAHGRDLLELQDGVGIVIVAGTATTQTDARQCLTGEAQADASMTGISNFAVLKDPETGQPVAQGDAADAAAVFTFTMQANDGSTQPMAMLLDCRIASQTEILVTAVASTAQFANEATAFMDIAGGITVNPSQGHGHGNSSGSNINPFPANGNATGSNSNAANGKMAPAGNNNGAANGNSNPAGNSSSSGTDHSGLNPPLQNL